MNILEKFEAKQLDSLKSEKEIPAFSPGDTVKVNVKIKEGTRERIQAYEGVCIARGGGGINETFTVRKMSYNVGVEKTFLLHSPRIEKIEVVSRGDVRRSKLYFLRERSGKSARIKTRFDQADADQAKSEKEAKSMEEKSPEVTAESKAPTAVAPAA